MKPLKLRNAWMVLNSVHGSILTSVHHTRRECIARYCESMGAPWEHRKKMGDRCIPVTIYARHG